MRFYTKEECEAWLSGRGRFTPGSVPGVFKERGAPLDAEVMSLSFRIEMGRSDARTKITTAAQPHPYCPSFKSTGEL